MFVILVDKGSSYNSYATMYTVFTGGKFYFNFILIIGTCAMIDLLTTSISILFNHSLAGKLMVLNKERSGLNSKVDLPDDIVKLLKSCEDSDEENEDEREISPKKTNSKGRLKETNVNIINVDNRRANEIDLERIDGVTDKIELSNMNGHKLNIESQKNNINQM